ncbi:Ribokinase [Lunatimonas lonarensis]|uniref:Ribokinase n=1 Tax=Lunatimonas lonarensis TaxID=1232681 RepID=R7ZYR4_9BACT|nr:ribokinase [Lunatimonas lonarensis]EON79237.1 Ribokinase [Lunatimonas lonarensis]
MKSSNQILVVGSSNTDMVLQVPRIPAPGETILGSHFFIVAGGKGANQAVAAARTGAEVTFVTCVGDDAFGRQAIENYRKDGIDTDFIKVQPGTHTGVALINVSDDGENSISVASGANNHLLASDMEGMAEAFKGAKIVLAQLETPLETIERVAQLAESNGIPFILNPAPATELRDGLLEKVSILTPNETEAALLTGRKEAKEGDLGAIADELLGKGVKTVIITLGSKGVYLRDSQHREMIPGYTVQAVDTTAAGDVFNGSLAAALAAGQAIREAIDFAQRAAAISVTRRGAQPSAPFLHEVVNSLF